MENNDKEIERILNEAPPEPKLKPEKKVIQTKSKFKIPKKKTIIIGVVILVIIFAGFIIIPGLGSEECIVDTTTNKGMIDSIKQEIINNGYAELDDGTSVLKIAPYTG